MEVRKDPLKQGLRLSQLQHSSRRHMGDDDSFIFTLAACCLHPLLRNQPALSGQVVEKLPGVQENLKQWPDTLELSEHAVLCIVFGVQIGFMSLLLIDPLEAQVNSV